MTTYNPYRQNHGAMIPNWLLCRPEVRPGAKIAYGRLCQYAGKDGKAWPKREDMAKALGVCPRTVDEYLWELKEHGLILVQRRGNKTPIYSFVDHEWRHQDPPQFADRCESKRTIRRPLRVADPCESDSQTVANHYKEVLNQLRDSREEPPISPTGEANETPPQVVPVEVTPEPAPIPALFTTFDPEPEPVLTLTATDATPATNTYRAPKGEKKTAPGFDEFWAAYPKKSHKQEAREAFTRLWPSAGLLHDMLEAIQAQRRSAQWQEYQYIPNPATWINKRRWEDEVPPEACAARAKPNGRPVDPYAGMSMAEVAAAIRPSPHLVRPQDRANGGTNDRGDTWSSRRDTPQLASAWGPPVGSGHNQSLLAGTPRAAR